MRTIIAGCRTCTDMREVEIAMSLCGWVPSVVISGAAPGVDKLGERWAQRRHIPVERFPADWTLGNRAGPIRNVEMAKNADALVAVWDGESTGTGHMIKTASRYKLQVYIHRID
jgi:SLOG family YspA-like protein